MKQAVDLDLDLDHPGPARTAADDDVVERRDWKIGPAAANDGGIDQRPVLDLEVAFEDRLQRLLPVGER